MEDERQITVRGEPPPIEAWVRWISDPDIAGWSRGIEIERKLKQKRDARWPMCLVWSGEGRHPKTALFLQPGAGSSIVVRTIAPIDRKELTPGDRRAALDAFQAALISSKDQCWGQRPLLEEALRKQAFADSVIRELLAAYDHADGLLTRYDFERD